jgi:hypothetical protein
MNQLIDGKFMELFIPSFCTATIAWRRRVWAKSGREAKAIFISNRVQIFPPLQR